jgi:hypothetical protein
MKGGHNRKKFCLEKCSVIDIKEFREQLTENKKLTCGNTVIYIAVQKTGYGQRLFLKCPLCGRRVFKVYKRWDSFACRICQKLNYKSSQNSGERKIEAVIQRFNRRYKIDFNPFELRRPEKPKYMRLKKWEILNKRMDKLEDRMNKAFCESMDKFYKSICMPKN